MRSSIARRLFIAASAAAMLAVGAARFVAPAAGNPGYLEAFEARYPGSTLVYDIILSAGSACNVCHNTNAFFGDWNCYRRDIIRELRKGASIEQALANIEQFDSDADGFVNVEEILAPRQGSNGASIGYNPGLVGPLGTDPCLSITIEGTPGSALPVTFRLETPPAVVACNPADIADTDGSPGPDRATDNGDFTLFFSAFFAPVGSPVRPFADIASTDGDPGADGSVDNGDFTLFFASFFEQCGTN